VTEPVPHGRFWHADRVGNLGNRVALAGQESHDGRAVGGHSIAAGFCHHFLSRGLEQY
jgi:hypothetical protein